MPIEVVMEGLLIRSELALITRVEISTAIGDDYSCRALEADGKQLTPLVTRIAKLEKNSWRREFAIAASFLTGYLCLEHWYLSLYYLLCRRGLQAGAPRGDRHLKAISMISGVCI